MQNNILIGDSVNASHNLAVEELLFDKNEDRCIFYLWQNENTVVIGKHQNAWKECRIQLLEEEGGFLARRTSGGGAVYHDLGNLNFTFILPRANYDVRRQLSVIQHAAGAFGIETMFTGRNDLVVTENGAKFSGNAFRLTGRTGMHHGTVLVDVDMEKLSRYLVPSKEKMQTKGIESVRSRVCNLKELNPSITIPAVREALCKAFTKEYGEASLLREGDLDPVRLAELESKYASWDWRLGQTPSFDILLEKRFDWGDISLYLSLSNGAIEHVKVFSDSMDEELISCVAPALVRCKFVNQSLQKAMISLQNPRADDIAAWLANIKI